MLNQTSDKVGALKSILSSATEFSEDNEEDQFLIECTEDFLRKSFPEIERIVDPFLERNGFTLVGGTKGVGKSLFVVQMALHIASGKSGFLNCAIDKPCNVLLIQQEVSENGMHDRLNKMVSEGGFETQRRFFLKTTTENQWHLTIKEHKDRIIAMIEQTSADVLILDPLYTFFPGELNQAKDISQIIQPMMELKTGYDLSLVVVHHFSNKSGPDDPKPIQGKFIGHSNLTNAADITVGINCLPPNFKDPSLPLPFSHYAKIETTTRHHEWPEDLYIERKEGSLLFTPSNVWIERGRTVPPPEIVDFVKECGGEKLQKEVIAYFKRTKKVHETTIRKSIKEAIRMGGLQKASVPGTHNMKILKIPEQKNEGGI
ncbi:AAA family ATPase [Acidobacteriota bacterium]